MAGSRLLAIVPTDSRLMSTTLATRCPHCETPFRVALQQLALRDGMVRCGACRQIFNGNDYLSEYSIPTDAVASIHTADDTAGPITLLDFGPPQDTAVVSESTMQEELDALSKAIADLQNKPWSEPASSGLAATYEEETESPAPGFVQEARERERAGRGWTILLMVGVPLLLVALSAQLGYLFRNEIAARSPEAARYMRAACRRIACTITLPAQIEALSIESRQLQALPDQANHFELVILLRNISNTSQTWPALDLQLNDAIGQAEIRKIFMPADFLKASEIRAGIPAASEREIRLRFELSGDPAYGFNIRIFYP